MPEGKKKDSFTFSDKIKNSKPAGSKSFANRVFSKIGKDGKPRQTLYERTRRDAPFFVAAVIALLLLPFLYKYSGSVSDENERTPITGDMLQDPDSRDGYYSFVDPGNSTLAPYPGNDTALLLVKPYAGEDSGAITEEEIPTVNVARSEERDAYASKEATKKASKLRDKETNILNEYRTRAAATTRKAIKRNPTAIGKLGSANMRRPGGSKLGVNMWGGGLKGAANKVKPNGPTEGPKPVSLQPLTAAGKPSRSSFGQGHLAAAQKSKDAMSKGNPLEALRDAQVRALDNHHVGGMDFDRNPFGPGGGGQLKHDFNYNAKEPWWWDMMKTRMQTQWQKMFDYKWGWIDWGTDLLRHWLGGFLNCLVTGNEDGDMGTMFGSGGGNSTKDPTCCGIEIAKLTVQGKSFELYKKEDPNLTEKRFCDYIKSDMKLGGKSCSGGYKAGRSYSTAGTGWWDTRKSCFGIAGKGAAAINFDESEVCNLFNNTNGRHFFVNPEGMARDWNTYIYVIARNEIPPSLKAAVKGKITGLEEGLLCVRSRYALSSSGGRTNHGTGVYDDRDAAKKDVQGVNAGARRKAQDRDQWEANYDRDDIMDSCVIAVSHGTEFDYDAFQTKVVDLFKKLLTDSNVTTNVDEIAKEAFGELKLMRIEAMIAKDKLANASHTLQKEALPMPYGLFRAAYIRHKGVATHPLFGKWIPNRQLDKLALRTENVDRLWGGESQTQGDIGCDWVNRVSVNCEDVSDPAAKVATATLTFVSLDKTSPAYTMNNINVQAQLEISGDDAGSITTKNNIPLGAPTQAATDIIKQRAKLDFGGFETTATENKDFQGNITWVVTDKNGQRLDAKTCAFNATAETTHTQVVEDPEPEEVPEPKEVEKVAGTFLAKRISIVPVSATDRQPSLTYEEKIFGSNKLVKNATDRAHCLDASPLGINNAKAKQFVENVIVKYNEQNPNANLTYLGMRYKDDPNRTTYPTTGELVDALNIAKQVNITKVPKSAVCALARNMVRMSQDTHAKGDWHNDFGAFLAYINDASILYPAKFTHDAGQKKCDSRFLSSYTGASECTNARTQNMPLRYHYSNYNLAYCVNTSTETCEKEYTGKSRYTTYVKSLETLHMDNFPLKDLVSHKAPWIESELQANDAHEYVKEYNSSNNRGYAGLLSDPDLGFGNACESFYAGQNNPEMNVEDALRYVAQVCTEGLDAKPWGQGKDNKADKKAIVNGDVNTDVRTHAEGDQE